MFHSKRNLEARLRRALKTRIAPGSHSVGVTRQTRRLRGLGVKHSLAIETPERVAGCGLRVAGCGLRVAGCGLRVAGCGLRVEKNRF
jgi:hypothetical protein